MDFVSHFWRLMALRSVEAMVTIQPKIECYGYIDNSAGRKKLAEDCFNRVLGRVAEGDAIQEDAEDSGRERPTTLLPS